MKATARKLAAKGRYGDTELLHISPSELLMLESSGKITRNPKTGLPEAFSLGDITGGISSLASGITNSFGNLLGSAGSFINPLTSPFSDPTSLLSGASGGGSALGPVAGGQTLMPGEQSTGGSGSPVDILKKLGLGSMNPMQSLLDVGSGIFGLNRANKTRQTGQDAANAMNPFGGERAMYAQKLRELYANPGNVTALPGYQAGLTAVERSMAANGYLGSGNMMTALQDYGGKAFNDEASRLALLSGAGFAPNGGNLALGGQTAANDLMGKSLGTLGFATAGNGIWNLLKNASGGLGNIFGNLFGGGAGTTVGADAGSLLGEEGISSVLGSLGAEDGALALLAI